MDLFSSTELTRITETYFPERTTAEFWGTPLYKIPSDQRTIYSASFDTIVGVISIRASIFIKTHFPLNVECYGQCVSPTGYRALGVPHVPRSYSLENFRHFAEEIARSFMLKESDPQFDDCDYYDLEEKEDEDLEEIA